MSGLETGSYRVFLGCDSKIGLSTRKLKVNARSRRELFTFYARKESVEKGKVPVGHSYIWFVTP